MKAFSISNGSITGSASQAENAGADSKDGWATLKVGATLVVVHGEVSVNFGTIWKGITK